MQVCFGQQVIVCEEVIYLGMLTEQVVEFGNTELTASPIAPRKCLTLNLPSLFHIKYTIETRKW